MHAACGAQRYTRGHRAAEAISLIFEANREPAKPGAVRIDARARPPYKPHATANGERSREADLSTQQAGAQAPSWLSRPPQDHGWPQGSGRPPRARTQAAQRLMPARATRVATCSGSGNAPISWPQRPVAKAPVGGFVLQARDRHEDGPVRVGFTVSKKVGNAVERNRVRRRLARGGAAFAARPDAAGIRLCADRPAGGAGSAVRPAGRGFQIGRSTACSGTAQARRNPATAGDWQAPERHPTSRDQIEPDMTDQKNTILAIVLSALVLIAWQYFVGMPQMEKQRQEAQLKQQQQQQQQVQQPGQAVPAPPAGQPAQPGAPGRPQPARQLSRPGRRPPTPRSRSPARRRSPASPRVTIDTPRLRGSIALRGAQVDDLALMQVPRDRRSEIAADRAAVAVRQPAPVLRRVRLGRAAPAPPSSCPTATRSGRNTAPARSASAGR